MKHLFISSAALFGILAAPSISQAQDDVLADEVVIPKKEKEWFGYADINIATTQFSDSDGRTTYVTDSATSSYIRVGAKYRYFGAEVELGNGLSDIEEDELSLGVSSQKAIFGILRAPGDNYDVFIRAGYHSSKIEFGADVIDFSETVTSNGFAAGVGGTYYFTDNFGLRADITGYNTRDTLEAGFVAASLGATARF